jgi:NADH:ubiquinone oxidoreductase subunit F (NADH-binding)
VSASRLSAASPAYADHHRSFGSAPGLSPGSLAGLLHDAGLTGRGGAGFPTGRKLNSVRSNNAVVIGNGAEGEPLSGKDAWLLHRAPHLVLDGLTLTADDISAADVYLYIPSRSVCVVRRAIDERRACGVKERAVHIVEAPDTYIAGEKSAVISRIQGGRALPLDQTVSASVSGVRGRPTLVCNVETLAHIALIARFGPRWFRAVGDPADPGTMLVTLSGALRTEVTEVPTGTTLLDLIRQRTDPGSLAAVLVGGYHGRWIPAEALDRVTLGRGSGTGIVHGLGASECGVERTAAFVGYLAEQSAGQCGPCRNGLPQLAELMSLLARGHGDEGLPAEIDRIAGLVDGRGACHHPDGTARLVRSALRTFSVDIGWHCEGHCLPAARGGRSA